MDLALLRLSTTFLSEQISGSRKDQQESNKPYGSHWGFQHLNWLNVHIAVGHDPKDLFLGTTHTSTLQKMIANDYHSGRPVSIVIPKISEGEDIDVLKAKKAALSSS